jgi:flagellum-specific peptidoglycan hydrolase FlgJ
MKDTIKKILIVVLFLYTIQGQAQELQKFKKNFYANYYDMAYYTYYKWDVPTHITLAIISIETNYGKNKKRVLRGDMFGTGKDYEFTNSWDEFGLRMKTTHFHIEGSVKHLIKVSNRIEEQLKWAESK